MDCLLTRPGRLATEIRIKDLAANPRTARGFSGDLILDEFAFHHDDAAIWEAAEPILSSNKDFLCRIASTGNGRYNMFYRMATGGRVALNLLKHEPKKRSLPGKQLDAGWANACLLKILGTKTLKIWMR